MEEGTVSFPDPQYRAADVISMSATKMAQKWSSSKNKGSTSLDGFNRFFGENLIMNTAYACGQSGRQIKPTNLTLLDFLILAQATHNFAPEYTLMERNCYWYCNMVFDACLELFRPDVSDGSKDEDKRNAKFSPHDTAVSGRMRGMKVSHTKREELSAVLRDYKKAHKDAFSTVKLIFS
jgi:hypothetical protein